MKTYHINITKNGSHLCRTQPQSYDDFKKTLNELKPLLDCEGIQFTIYRDITQSSCTYNVHIDKSNAIDILDNLALEEE